MSPDPHYPEEPLSELGAELPAVDPPPPAALASCWRCEKDTLPELPHCVHCRAPLRKPGTRGPEKQSDPDLESWPPILPMIVGYMTITGANILFGVVSRSENQHAQGFKDLVPFLLPGEIVMALIVLIVALLLRRRTATPAPTAGVQVTMWVLGPFLLAGLLGLNYLYHRTLLDFLGLRDVPQLPGWRDAWGWAVLLICVQPALVEELFFRRVALGGLRRAMGPHAAVLVSALMFGLAHLGAPLSIPILCLVGVGLGYARVYSGNLLLPVLMHFAHNLLVLHLMH